MKSFQYIKKNKQVIVILNNKSFTVRSVDKKYNDVLKAIDCGDYDTLNMLLNPEKKIKESLNLGGYEFIAKNGNFYITFEDAEPMLIHPVFFEKLKMFAETGEDLEPLMRFIENLYTNPSHESLSDMYLFLEHNHMPLTANGNFLGYKWVSGDYKDCHTHSFDNHVGCVNSMPRSKCDPDREHTCSTGFHVCNKDYYKFGERLMVVEVNPRDVVSVPVDYDFSKMRVCKYTVIDEIPVEDYGCLEQEAEEEIATKRFKEKTLSEKDQKREILDAIINFYKLGNAEEIEAMVTMADIQRNAKAMGLVFNRVKKLYPLIGKLKKSLKIAVANRK